MPQNDFVIGNQTAPNFRADLNSALQALSSLSSGATAPSTTYANMLWYDTGNNILKMRSEADDAWVNVGYLDQATNRFFPYIGATQVDFKDEDDMASNSATSVPSQQSVKAYVDAEVAAVPNVTSTENLSDTFLADNGTDTVTFTGVDTGSGLIVDLYYIFEISGFTNAEVGFAYSTDGGSSWSSDVDFFAYSVGDSIISFSGPGKFFLDYTTRTWFFVGGDYLSSQKHATGTISSSSVNAIRFYNTSKRNIGAVVRLQGGLT